MVESYLLFNNFKNYDAPNFVVTIVNKSCNSIVCRDKCNVFGVDGWKLRHYNVYYEQYYSIPSLSLSTN